MDIKAKTQNLWFYDPSLTHREPECKSDHLSSLPVYDFLLPLNTLKTFKTNNKEDKTTLIKVKVKYTHVEKFSQTWGINVTI